MLNSCDWYPFGLVVCGVPVTPGCTPLQHNLHPGLATGSPLTPLHPQQLQMGSKGGTPATARNTRRTAASRAAAAAPVVAAVPGAARGTGSSKAGGRGSGSSGGSDAAAGAAGGSSGGGAAAGSVVGSAGEEADGFDVDPGCGEAPEDQDPTGTQRELPARSAAPQLPHRRGSMAHPAAAVAMAAVTAAAAAAFKEPAPVVQQQQEAGAGAAAEATTPAARGAGRAGSSKGAKRKAHTPYEGRMAKQRKSLAGGWCSWVGCAAFPCACALSMHRWTIVCSDWWSSKWVCPPCIAVTSLYSSSIKKWSGQRPCC
jgi:hypothetical protein